MIAQKRYFDPRVSKKTEQMLGIDAFGLSRHDQATASNSVADRVLIRRDIDAPGSNGKIILTGRGGKFKLRPSRSAACRDPGAAS